MYSTQCARAMCWAVFVDLHLIKLYKLREKNMSKIIPYIGILYFLMQSVSASAITLDGVLDESEWAEARIVNNFTTVEPYSLVPPEHSTLARIISNKDGIYIGIVNEQGASSQRVERIQRDGDQTADNNQIIIDFDNNKAAAYGFIVGSGGSIRDGIWSDENNFSHEWDGNWKAATHSDDKAWTSEIFIPWDIAPMAKAVGDKRELAIYIGRQVSYLAKEYASAGINASGSRFLSEFPSLTINNYASSSFNAFVSSTGRVDLLNDEQDGDVSLELFWKPDTSKQISLALNPDFGQVESDDLVVNFSAEESFFGDKRPFFTENQSLFDVSGTFGLRMVHTRRMGGLSDVGGETADIDAALKFTSNGEQYSYGAFAVTERDGDVSQGRDYFAGRLVKNTQKSNLGYMATYVERPDLLRTAATHSFDYKFKLDQKFTLSGNLINALVDGKDSLEGEIIEKNDVSASAKLEYQKNKNFYQLYELNYFGDEFDVNDMGFLRRNNFRHFVYHSNLQVPTRDTNSKLKNKSFLTWFEYMENLEGEVFDAYVFSSNTFQFKDTSEHEFSAWLLAEANDDQITRGNNTLKTEASWEFGYRYSEEKYDKFRYEFQAYAANFAVRGYGWDVHFRPTVTLAEGYSVGMEFDYKEKDDWKVWQQDNDIDSFSRRQFDSSINFNAQFSAKQELRLKFQWISLSAKGQDAFTVSDNGELIEQDREVDSFGFSNTALQLRYQYKLGPLSNIFVVYSRGATEDYEDRKNVFGTFSDGWQNRTGDNLLVKVRFKI
ncbi:MAG: hypothetical protein ACI93R_001657 [Flavobacteriales bacterium]|jgi:hypothetical protein